jgi:hypothetical protein
MTDSEPEAVLLRAVCLQPYGRDGGPFYLCSQSAT